MAHLTNISPFTMKNGLNTYRFIVYKGETPVYTIDGKANNLYYAREDAKRNLQRVRGVNIDKNTEYRLGNGRLLQKYY